MISVSPASPFDTVAVALLQELSAALMAITGSSGSTSWDPNDVADPRAEFVVARDNSGQPLGCGALRPLQGDIGEIKRMYARPGTRGVGMEILAHLEQRAIELGYREVWLETRAVNQRAVDFYQRHGYRRIANFGRYAGRDDAVCFAKSLVQGLAG